MLFLRRFLFISLYLFLLSGLFSGGLAVAGKDPGTSLLGRDEGAKEGCGSSVGRVLRRLIEK